MYGHLTVEELTILRDKLQTSLTARLTAPTSAEGSGRRVQYQQDPAKIRAELNLVLAELSRRSGTVARGPIYMVG